MSLERLTPAQIERFKRLAWPWLDVVLRTAKFLSHRDDRAEDLAQETMIKAMRAIDTYRDDSDMKAWLLTILRHTHIDRLRAEQRRGPTLSLDALEFDPPETDARVGVFDEHWRHPQELIQRFEDQAVIDALQSLPQDIRWTLLLVDVQQMQQTDAAAILDVPLGTIKSRIHRGRAMLRDRLYELAGQRGWITASASNGEGNQP